jgi:thiamine pyrophosphokinase
MLNFRLQIQKHSANITEAPSGCFCTFICLLKLLLLILTPHHQKGAEASFIFTTGSSLSSAQSATTLMTSTTIKEEGGAVVSFSSPIFGPKHREQQRTVLIILNTPIPKSPCPWFDQLWQASDERICADGGANRLYAYSTEYIPNRIRGDLDSLNPTVRAFYEERNVNVERDPCQDTNDLDKALQVCVTNGSGPLTAEKSHPAQSSCRVVVYGAFGGRFDQEMASFAALYKWAPKFNWQMYLYSDETCAFLIPESIPCEIQLPFYDGRNLEENPSIEDLIGEGPTCGLIPLGCRCESITTAGLKWDLDGTIPMEFGGLVSSSNRIMKPVVKVLASHPIVFTAELLTKKQS